MIFELPSGKVIQAYMSGVTAITENNNTNINLTSSNNDNAEGNDQALRRNTSKLK